MTPVRDHVSGGDRPRFSRLAGTAIFLAPLLAIGTVAISLFAVCSKPEPGSGLAGLGWLIGVAVGIQVVLIGGSITAALAIVMGRVAVGKIRSRPYELRGLPTARAAVSISVTSLIGVWGAVAIVAGVIFFQQAPHRAAEADIRTAFEAVVRYARNNDTFPDTLEQVTSSKTAARYVYLGRGLPSEYADFETQASERVLVMYATHDVDGKFTAIFSNGGTHEWTKPVLEGVLRKDTEQKSRGLSMTVKHEPRVDGRTLGYRIKQLMSEDKASRSSALNELARFGSKAGPAVPALIAALKDEDDTIRHGATY